MSARGHQPICSLRVYVVRSSRAADVVRRRRIGRDFMISNLQNACRSLAGRRVLLVEDSAPLSVFLKKALHDAGAEVVGPAATLVAAEMLARVNDGLSVALLDIRLHGGEEVWPVAGILASEDVPFVFYSAHHDATTLPAE
jgi:hypothetical protein